MKKDAVNQNTKIIFFFRKKKQAEDLRYGNTLIPK